MKVRRPLVCLQEDDWEEREMGWFKKKSSKRSWKQEGRFILEYYILRCILKSAIWVFFYFALSSFTYLRGWLDNLCCIWSKRKRKVIPFLLTVMWVYTARREKSWWSEMVWEKGQIEVDQRRKNTKFWHNSFHKNKKQEEIKALFGYLESLQQGCPN